VNLVPDLGLYGRDGSRQLVVGSQFAPQLLDPNGKVVLVASIREFKVQIKTLETVCLHEFHCGTGDVESACKDKIKNNLCHNFRRGQFQRRAKLVI
jgi:hypothetical protein